MKMTREMKVAIRREIKKQMKLGKSLDGILEATRIQFSSFSDSVVIEIYREIINH